MTRNYQGASGTADCDCGACSGRHRGAGRCLTFAAKCVLLEEDIWHLPNTQIQMWVYSIYTYICICKYINELYICTPRAQP